MLESVTYRERTRSAGCWSAGVLFILCLVGSAEALALPMAGEYQIDLGSELRICSEITGCQEPVSIAGARFWFAPESRFVLQRELSDMTYDLYEGGPENVGVYRIFAVINSPDLQHFAFSDDSYLTFSSDTSFEWTGSFIGYLPCDSFGLDPSTEDCWSLDYRDFELINVSATMVPEPSNATLLSSGLLGILVIGCASRNGSRVGFCCKQSAET